MKLAITVLESKLKRTLCEEVGGNWQCLLNTKVKRYSNSDLFIYFQTITIFSFDIFMNIFMTFMNIHEFTGDIKGYSSSDTLLRLSVLRRLWGHSIGTYCWILYYFFLTHKKLDRTLDYLRCHKTKCRPL